MKSLFVLIAVLLFASCSKLSVQSPRPDSKQMYSVLQGSTTEDSTIIRVVFPKSLRVNYLVLNSKGQNFDVKKIGDYARKFSEFRVQHIRVTGLSLNETYTLKIGSDKQKWTDVRTFKTLDTNKNDLSIMIASCMSDTYNELGNIMWPKAFSHNPDVSFLIGDNIYADIFAGVYLGNEHTVTPAHLWNRHVDQAMKMKVYRMKHLVPTYVTWDDHDFGKNNGGKEYKYKTVSKNIFNIFFPREKAKNLNFGPGVSSHLKLAGMNFLFLDNRTFRDGAHEEKGAHFGKTQRKWIRKNISNKEINWLISGDQFFGGYHKFESFEGNHGETFKGFIQDIKDSKGKVVFVSGDRHLIEVMKIPAERLGQETYEYTVSGIQTKTFPGSLKRNPNPLRTGGIDGIPNYAIIRVNKKQDATTLTFKAYSPQGMEFENTHAF